MSSTKPNKTKNTANGYVLMSELSQNKSQQQQQTYQKQNKQKNPNKTKNQTHNHKKHTKTTKPPVIAG